MSRRVGRVEFLTYSWNNSKWIVTLVGKKHIPAQSWPLYVWAPHCCISLVVYLTFGFSQNSPDKWNVQSQNQQKNPWLLNKETRMWRWFWHIRHSCGWWICMQQANLGYCCAYGNICSTAKCWKKPDIVHSGKSPPDSTSSTKGGPASCRCTPLNITVFELWNDFKIELLTFLRWLQMSFEPLVRCLDVDNVLRFFTAILLERRVLLRANK